MALSTMIKNLNKARDEYEKQKEALGKNAAKAVAEAFAEVLPDGYLLKWTQYTPYFNDGEPCTFRVHDPALHDADNEEGDGVEVTSWSLKNYGKESWSPRRDNLSAAAIKRVLDVWSELPEDLLESAFGDHTEVIVRKDGSYSNDEYSHD